VVVPTGDEVVGAVAVVDGRATAVDEGDVGGFANVVDVDREVVGATDVEVDAPGAVVVVRVVVVVVVVRVVRVTAGANGAVWIGTGAGRTRM
jgi:hypothetical protein